MKGLTVREIIELCGKDGIDLDSRWIAVKSNKYNLQLDLGLDFVEHSYLNYNKNNGYFMLGGNYEGLVYKTEFTDRDIEELGIPAEHFKKIKVNQ